MADPLREALAALADRLGHYGANASDLRRLLAAHPEPEPSEVKRLTREIIRLENDARAHSSRRADAERERDSTHAAYVRLLTANAVARAEAEAEIVLVEGVRCTYSAHDVQWPAGGVLSPEPTEPPAPEGAVRVRIAVAVDADGEWYAVGDSAETRPRQLRDYAASFVGETTRLSWVEAWVPRPAAEQVVEGRVEPEGSE